MSIYLQGVCSSLPFYLSKHIWCPVAGASNRNVCFPEDACSLFIQFCALVVWLCCIRQKRPHVRKGEIFSACSGQDMSYCDISAVCVLVTITQTIHVTSEEHLKPATFNVLSHSENSFWAYVSHFIHLSMLLPLHLMWQPILRKALIAVTPMGVRDTAVCCNIFMLQ